MNARVPPEEWAERFLSAVLPFYAPVVAYSVSLLMLILCAVLIWSSHKQRKTLAMMVSAQADNSAAVLAIAKRYEELNAKLQISIDEHAEHRVVSKTQFETLIAIQERFFAQPVMTVGPLGVATGKAATSDAEASIAPQDDSEPL